MSDRRKKLLSELLQIKGKRELITAEEIVHWAGEHRSSAWAAELDWNDKSAAHEHRINQVRQIIITLEITIGEPTRRFYSLSIDRNKKGGGYRDITDILQTKTLYEIMLKDALRDLERMKEKYEMVKELKTIWREMEKIKKRSKT